MSRARVIVFGYGPVAVTGLRTLEHVGADIAAVVLPSNRSGDDVERVATYARAHDWPVLIQPARRVRAPFVDALRALAPDLLLVWSYSMLITADMIAAARHGAVNVHGGLLPEYRGCHVMNWAIANGETETGVTLHYIDEGIDTGDVIAIERVAIDHEDDAVSVRDKLARAGAHLVEQWWPSIAAGSAPRSPQDASRARYWRVRTADDGRINWSGSAESICNLVRALVAPWPGAFTLFEDKKIVVRRCAMSATHAARAAGIVTAVDTRGVTVACGTGSIVMNQIEIDGRPIGPAEWSAAGLQAGVVLG